MANGEWQMANDNIKTISHKLLAISSRAKRGFISEPARKQSSSSRRREGFISAERSLKGFTLIEILVAITLFAVVGAISADLFFSVIRASNKANIIVELERNGNVALMSMATEIRNALSIAGWCPCATPPCTCTGTSLVIKNQDGENVTFSFAVTAPASGNSYVARNGNPITDTAKASGVNVTNLFFEATIPAGSPPIVTITLGLSQPVAAPGRIDYQASTELKTTVSLRTY